MDARLPTPVDLAARLIQLEHQVRRLSAVLAVTLVAAGALAVLGLRSAPPLVVSAERFVLHGPRGVGTAEIAITEGNWLRIKLTDHRGWIVNAQGDSIPNMIRGFAGLELRAAPPELRLTDGQWNPILRLGPLERALH